MPVGIAFTAMVVAVMLQEAAVETNSTTMPRNWNTYRNVVVQHSVPSMKAMAATAVMLAIVVMETMMTHILLVMAATIVPLAQQEGEQRRKAKRCRRWKR